MPDGLNIRFLTNKEIDKSKWNKCIGEAGNGLVYGYSFYLDHMAKHWDALVLDDYKAVMPLTWKRKYGIYYLYQPPFTASLGVFGGLAAPEREEHLTERVIEAFIQAIPKKFKLIEISLNHGNILSSTQGFLIPRTNYILGLDKSYDELYNSYRENHQRNIQKAIQVGCSLKKNIDVQRVIHLSKQQMKDIAPVSNKDYEHFEKLYEFLSRQNKATTYGIINKQNLLLSSCVFFFSHNRAYYIMAGNHPAGRNTGASHALIDAFVKDHAGNKVILDFEGSDIESLGLFYSGFGAKQEIYPAMRWNKLPWWLEWLKRNY